MHNKEKLKTREVVLKEYFCNISLELVSLTQRLKGFNLYGYKIWDTEYDTNDELWVKSPTRSVLDKYIILNEDFGDTYKGDLRTVGKKYMVSTQLEDYREDKEFIKVLKNNPKYLEDMFTIVKIPIDYKYVIVEDEETGEETMYAGRGLIVL